MCRHGIFQVDELGPALVKKPTRFMTNAPMVLKAIAVRCTKGHRHITLQRGPGAGDAQAYPRDLRRKICLGIKRQCVADAVTGKVECAKKK